MADQLVSLVFRSVTGQAQQGIRGVRQSLSGTGRAGAAAGAQVESGFNRARRGTQRAGQTLRQYGIQIDGQKVSINDLRERLARLEIQRDKSFDPRSIANFNREISDLQGNIRRMQTLDSEPVRGMGSQLAGLAAGAGLAFGAFTVLRSGISRSIERGREFESQLAGLEAITGITGASLEQLGDESLELSKKFGESASDIIEANKLVASQLAQKIDFGTDEGFRQLQQVTEQAIVLKNAAGIELAEAVNAVTSTINQFNLSAEESGRVINTLAAGAKFGAAEVADIASAFRDSGAAAESAAVGLETNNAAVQVLAANAIRGEKAGTALRNIFLRLQTAGEDLAELGIENVDLKANGLTETLRQLTPLLDNAAGLQKIFGQEAFNAAAILINNADALEDLEEKVTGTNVAYEQAAVRLDTFDGATDKLSATIDSALIPAFTETGGAIVKVINATSTLIENFAGGIRVINSWVDSHSDLRREIDLNEKKVNSFIKEMKDARKETAEFAAQNELTAAEEKDFRESIDATNEAIHERSVAILEEGNALREKRGAVQDEIEDLERLKRQFGSLGLAQQGRLNILKEELSGLNLSIESNEKVFDSLVAAMQSGEADFDTFIRNIRLARDEQERLKNANEQTADSFTPLKEQIKGVNEEIERLLNQKNISTDDLFQIGQQLGKKEELEQQQRIREEILARQLSIVGQENEVEQALINETDQVAQTAHERKMQRISDENAAVQSLAANSIAAAAGIADAETRRSGISAAAWEQTFAFIGQAVAQEILYGKTVKDTTRGVIQAIKAEIIALQIRNALAFIKNPFLAAAIVGPAVALAIKLSDALIPKFQTGGIVTGRRHRDGGTLIEAEQGEFVVNRDSTS
ncbi:MAG TPA: phage tail tape measure protein, partial [Tichowtungia sp.]|nr:phage tail tape measure protein [Tichowtungia sp.]